LTELFDIEYNAVIIATAHNEFKEIDLTKISKNIHVLFDTKSIVEKSMVDGRM
jgi:UDP-N-acetyl-D-galactosamine dehydrogenase